MKQLKYITTLIVMLFTVLTTIDGQQQRFPKPEFQTEYEVPATVKPAPRAPIMEYLDLAVLIAVMSLTAYFIFKKRSRKGIFWLTVFSLIYFGFYRNGCICSVGSIQNVSLSIFGNNYSISYTVLALFLLPIIYTFFFGRVFCASACPLGAIQDLVIVKPLKIAPWLQKTLGLFPFIYLALAVLYAATNTDFMICRYDPFVGIFRMGAEFHMIVLGVSFLLIGMFVARPYCRFICPYGAILKVCSHFSVKHLSITPESCINCKLCKDSCPFEAIDYPAEEKENKASQKDYKRFVLYIALIPVLMFVFGWVVSASYKTLSKAHPDVALAELILSDPEAAKNSTNLDIQTFMSSGRSLEVLVKDAVLIQNKFKTGGLFAGAFIGMVIGISLLYQVMFKKRTIYEANKANCLSCGRCMEYCPVGKPEHPYHKEAEKNEDTK